MNTVFLQISCFKVNQVNVMEKIPVYVSYARDEEEQNNMLSAMQNKLADIDFKIDTEQVRYGDDFMKFMNAIGEADYIVVVFSLAYLKSFYCMYELTKIMQGKGDINKRVFPVRDEKYDLNEVSNEKNIIDYWQQVVGAGERPRAKGLTKNGSISQAKEIQSQLPRIFEQFSTIHAPTAKELAPTLKLLFDDSFQAIREWLKEEMPEAVLAGKKQLSDEKFTFNVEKEITRIFKRFPVLYKSLIVEFEGVDDECGLAKLLCNHGDQADLLAYTLMGGCKSAVQSFKQKESIDKVHELKADIRKLLNCLCVMAINPDWVKKQNGNQQQVILIPVVSSLGEVATAGRVGQVIPDLKAEKENKFKGKYELSPFKTESWDNANNLVVDAILKFVFNEVFEIPQLKSGADNNGKITEGQRIELNTQIKLNASDSNRHYYCMLRKKETAPQFISDPDVIKQIKAKLPALDIFELQDTMGNVVFLVADEHELSQTYYYFLTQLEQW